MITRFRYHQVLLSEDPTHPDHGHVDVIHADGGQATVVGTEFSGGGGDKRFLLHVVTSEILEEGKDAWTPPRSDDNEDS